MQKGDTEIPLIVGVTQVRNTLILLGVMMALGSYGAHADQYQPTKEELEALQPAVDAARAAKGKRPKVSTAFVYQEFASLIADLTRDPGVGDAIHHIVDSFGFDHDEAGYARAEAIQAKLVAADTAIVQAVEDSNAKVLCNLPRPRTKEAAYVAMESLTSENEKVYARHYRQARKYFSRDDFTLLDTFLIESVDAVMFVEPNPRADIEAMEGTDVRDIVGSVCANLSMKKQARKGDTA
ncbi:MAG: hypothetical protein AAF385_09390 [Pseudomonadota bacterium]